MRLKIFSLLLLLLTVGCVTTPPPENIPRAALSFPSEALMTQRAVLTVRGRQFTLNGYVAKSEARGLRLVVTENFGDVLADVLVKPDGGVFVVQAKPPLRADWVDRYIAADLKCIFGNGMETNCPVKILSPTHSVIQRRWYKLDLQIVEIKPGAQPPGLFDEIP